MSMHLHRDLERLRKNLLMLSALVEETTRKAVEFMTSQSESLAREVEMLEERINDAEVDIEEECLKILALHQPVAVDLRFIILVLKVNNDLERMGDQAMNIVSRVRSISDVPDLTAQLELPRMSHLVLEMVKSSLEALIQTDPALAKEVVVMDDEVDKIHADTYDILREYVMEHPAAVATAMSYATISSNLERIGDLSTNIAEEVTFMIEGRVVRHKLG